MKNINRVPKKQWNRWNSQARFVFNETYKFMMKNPDVMNHPKEKQMTPFHWKTVAWNSAWIAADACIGYTNHVTPTEILRRKAA
ncbi:MAG TPA: hypothetical protein VIY48_10360 [Candidatus Paceibacterota bacterium]